MRLLCVSDIHLEKQNVPLLREKLKDKAIPIEAVIMAGDFTTHGSEFAAEEIVKGLRLIGKLLAIPGNMDTKQVLELMENKGISIHNKVLAFGNYEIAGFGGGLAKGPGHINFSEKELENSLEKLLPGDCGKTILVTHLPPFGTSLDLTNSSTHIGSKAVKKIIEQKQPLLHLCGHCHEALGEELFGRTLSINIGSLKHGKAVLVDLDGKIGIERIELF